MGHTGCGLGLMASRRVMMACYSMPAQRLSAINGALPADCPCYEAGRIVGSATLFYPTTIGGVDMVTSPYDGAAASSATANNKWHTVGVLRHRNTVWLHNPAYTSPSDTAEPQKVPMVPGMSNVTGSLTAHALALSITTTSKA